MTYISDLSEYVVQSYRFDLRYLVSKRVTLSKIVLDKCKSFCYNISIIRREPFPVSNQGEGACLILLTVWRSSPRKHDAVPRVRHRVSVEVAEMAILRDLYLEPGQSRKFPLPPKSIRKAFGELCEEGLRDHSHRGTAVCGSLGTWGDGRASTLPPIDCWGSTFGSQSKHVLCDKELMEMGSCASAAVRSTTKRASVHAEGEIQLAVGARSERLRVEEVQWSQPRSASYFQRSYEVDDVGEGSHGVGFVRGSTELLRLVGFSGSKSFSNSDTGFRSPPASAGGEGCLVVALCPDTAPLDTKCTLPLAETPVNEQSFAALDAVRTHGTVNGHRECNSSVSIATGSRSARQRGGLASRQTQPDDFGRGRRCSSPQNSKGKAIPVIRSKRGTFQIVEEELPEVQIGASVVSARLAKILGLLDMIPPHSATEDGFRLVRAECVEFKDRMVWLQTQQARLQADAAGEPEPKRSVAKQSPSSPRTGDIQGRREPLFQTGRPEGSTLEGSGFGDHAVSWADDVLESRLEFAVCRGLLSRNRPDERLESTCDSEMVRWRAHVSNGSISGFYGCLLLASLSQNTLAGCFGVLGIGPRMHNQSGAIDLEDCILEEGEGDPVAGCLENSHTVNGRTPFFPSRFYMTYIVLSYRKEPAPERFTGL